MTSLTQRAIAAAGALTLALTVSACGGANETNSASGETKKTDALTISATGVDDLPFMAMLQVGIDKKWFEDEGLKVSLYSGAGGGNTLRVVTSGDADMAIAGATSIVLASQKSDSNLTIVAPWFQINDFSWIAPAGASLDNAVLGFSSAGSSTELVAKALKAKLNNVTLQAVGGMGDNWTAARAKQITAGWAMQPFIAEKIATDGAGVLVESRKLIGDIPADLVAVNNDYAKANPENLKTFFRVADRINDWIVNDPAAAAKDLAPLLGVSEDVMTQALEQTPELKTAYSLKVVPETMKNLSDLMVQAEQTKTPVDWAKVMDQQYLPEDARTDF
jgi:NitT/TauT family transport system substrate-binding protein